MTIEQRGFCDEHAEGRKRQDDPHRPPAHLRGYDRNWHRLRNWHLRQNPVCKCGKPAEVAHHIVPIGEGGTRLDQANLQSLCRRCHEAEHGRAVAV